MKTLTRFGLKYLTHFSPMSHFYTPWKIQKTYDFLTFSVGIEMWHWTKILNQQCNENFARKSNRWTLLPQILLPLDCGKFRFQKKKDYRNKTTLQLIPESTWAERMLLSSVIIWFGNYGTAKYWNPIRDKVKSYYSFDWKRYFTWSTDSHVVVRT